MAIDRPKNKVAAVVLAAGGSVRMGTLKQQLPWRDTDLLGHAVRQALQSEADLVTVVLGSRCASLRVTLDREGVQVIENPDWQRGMGTSVARATRILTGQPTGIQALLFLLVDQPLMHYKHINKLIDSYLNNKNKIIASQYQGILGVPCLFGWRYFEELLHLEGDRGAKSVLLRHPEAVIAVECGSLCQDVDTREAYEALWQVHGQNELE